jgi:hypothetical protein
MSGSLDTCAGCGSTDLIELFDMGRQPLAEGGSAYRYPLCLVTCLHCDLVQLNYMVDQDEVFRPAHPYATGNSRALREHYAHLATELARPLQAGDVIVDIGANDGTLLSMYPRGSKPGLVKIAVEPTLQILKPEGNVSEFEIYQEFFTAALARRIREAHGPARVVTACNVLAHVPDVHDFLDGVTALLGGNGEFVTENHELASITDGLQIDTIYHEHLRYYTVGTLGHLLEQHGLHVISAQQTAMHGGSFRLRARKYQSHFQQRARVAATALRGMLWQLNSRRQLIYGIGAATRATPLIHYAGIAEFIACVCEVPGSDKIGQFIPGTQIPVVSESRLFDDSPPYALIFAWHLADDIMAKLRGAGYPGKFIIPLPEPRIVDG